MMFSLICAWTNGWTNNRDAGDLRRHRTHYEVSAMLTNDDIIWNQNQCWHYLRHYPNHRSGVIMSVMASQITGVSTDCSTVCSSADQIKYQNPASLAFVTGIHWWITLQRASDSENVSNWWRQNECRHYLRPEPMLASVWPLFEPRLTNASGITRSNIDITRANTRLNLGQSVTPKCQKEYL